MESDIVDERVLRFYKMTQSSPAAVVKGPVVRPLVQKPQLRTSRLVG